MTATAIEDSRLRNRSGVYRDRDDAGEHLALALEPFRTADAVVLAIPSGGVPVGLVVSSRLELPFDLLIIRKIPIPGYTESGFGAVSLEGDLVLNEPLVRELGLTPEEIEVLAESVQEELLARNRIFREDRPRLELAGKTVILVDDGLASGYTMMTAVRTVRRRKPSQIVVAVPTASASTIKLLASQVDTIVCPNIRSGYSFAVADAYRNWYDLERSEVTNLLKSHGLLANK
ncbi:MAG: phosphoribosyltransferase family protein [Methanothrix sp.]|nr:phosphoribosyltransferase family protein [Methanothrix sp.]